MSAPLRLGTRGSALATAQSGQVAGTLAAALGRPVELVTITTYGDTSTAPLAQIGGTGVFVIRAARGAARRPGRPRGALAEGPADRPAGGPAAGRRAAPRGPARRAGRPATDAHCSTCRPAPGSAPARPAGPPSCARSGCDLDVRRRPRQRGHPAAARSRDGELDAVVLAAAGLARLGRLGRGHRGARPDPDAAGPRPGGAGGGVPRRPTPTWSPRSPRARRPRRPGLRSRRSGPCWPASRPAARPRSARSPTAGRGRRCTSGRVVPARRGRVPRRRHAAASVRHRFPGRGRLLSATGWPLRCWPTEGRITGRLASVNSPAPDESYPPQGGAGPAGRLRRRRTRRPRPAHGARRRAAGARGRRGARRRQAATCSSWRWRVPTPSCIDGATAETTACRWRTRPARQARSGRGQVRARRVVRLLEGDPWLFGAGSAEEASGLRRGQGPVRGGAGGLRGHRSAGLRRGPADRRPSDHDVRVVDAAEAGSRLGRARAPARAPWCCCPASSDRPDRRSPPHWSRPAGHRARRWRDPGRHDHRAADRGLHPGPHRRRRQGGPDAPGRRSPWSARSWRCARRCPGSRPSRCSAGGCWCRGPRSRPARSRTGCARYGAVPEEVPTIAVEPPRTPQQMERAVQGLVAGPLPVGGLHLGQRACGRCGRSSRSTAWTPGRSPG